MSHEKNFCQYSLPCFTKFYGFLKHNEKIVGFIYEFMCNGSLDSYIKKNQINEMYSLMVILRLCEGIKYLHENKLIHRDLKPMNILVDHNYYPYISDFETIRSIELTESSFTNDIGSPLYSSPEQDFGENISFPADIYSFSLIIYYLYDKTDMHSFLSQMFRIL